MSIIDCAENFHERFGVYPDAIVPDSSDDLARAYKLGQLDANSPQMMIGFIGGHIAKLGGAGTGPGTIQVDMMMSWIVAIAFLDGSLKPMFDDGGQLEQWQFKWADGDSPDAGVSEYITPEDNHKVANDAVILIDRLIDNSIKCEWAIDEVVGEDTAGCKSVRDILAGQLGHGMLQTYLVLCHQAEVKPYESYAGKYLDVALRIVLCMADNRSLGFSVPKQGITMDENITIPVELIEALLYEYEVQLTHRLIDLRYAMEFNDEYGFPHTPTQD